MTSRPPITQEMHGSKAKPSETLDLQIERRPQVHGLPDHWDVAARAKPRPSSWGASREVRRIPGARNWSNSR